MIKLASRTTRITPSPTLQLSATVKALVAQGQRVFDFTAGEPSFDSPDEAKQAAITAIQSGFTKYTAVTGIDELKDAIIEGGKTRLRPVLLTAITTILGLLPLAVGLNINFHNAERACYGEGKYR